MFAVILHSSLSSEMIARVLMMLIYAGLSYCIYSFFRQAISWISTNTVMLFEDGEAFWLHITIALFTLIIEYYTPLGVMFYLKEQGPQYVFGNIVICASVLFFGVKLFGLVDRDLRRLSILSFLLLSVSGVISFSLMYYADKMFFP